MKEVRREGSGKKMEESMRVKERMGMMHKEKLLKKRKDENGSRRSCGEEAKDRKIEETSKT